MSNWRKSTYSNNSGGACVEVGTWRKSTYSNTSVGNCVETATSANTVLIRDTTDNGTGLTLQVTPAAWTAFLTTIK
jgi:hypothetical protein